MADLAPAPAPTDASATPAPVATTSVNPQADPVTPQPAWDGRTATPAPVAPTAPAPVDTALTTTPQPSTGVWPDDWRQRIANDVPEGDERTKALNLLQRLNDPAALLKKVREQDRLISSGAHRKAPGADATPEAMAAYRVEMGIPDKPEGYLEKLTDGFVIGEDDKPLVNLFLESMHKENAPPSTVQSALSAYYQIQEQAQAEFIKEQTVVKNNTVSELGQKWGGEYKANMNSINNVVDGFFGPVADQIKLAMLPDGTPLMNNKDALEGLAALASEINPGSAIIPAGSGNVDQSIDAEIAKIEKRMSTDYHGHMRDTAAQARYGQLLEAREKRTQRGMR